MQTDSRNLRNACPCSQSLLVRERGGGKSQAENHVCVCWLLPCPHFAGKSERHCLAWPGITEFHFPNVAFPVQQSSFWFVFNGHAVWLTPSAWRSLEPFASHSPDPRDPQPISALGPASSKIGPEKQKCHSSWKLNLLKQQLCCLEHAKLPYVETRWIVVLQVSG